MPEDDDIPPALEEGEAGVQVDDISLGDEELDEDLDLDDDLFGDLLKDEDF
jgi:hypothetical protein